MARTGRQREREGHSSLSFLRGAGARGDSYRAAAILAWLVGVAMNSVTGQRKAMITPSMSSDERHRPEPTGDPPRQDEKGTYAKGHARSRIIKMLGCKS